MGISWPLFHDPHDRQCGQNRPGMPDFAWLLDHGLIPPLRFGPWPPRQRHEDRHVEMHCFATVQWCTQVVHLYAGQVGPCPGHVRNPPQFWPNWVRRRGCMRSRCVRTGARKMHVVIHAVPWGRGWAGPHPSSTQASCDCLGRGGLAFDAADSDPEVYGGGTGLPAVHRTWGGRRRIALAGRTARPGHLLTFCS